MHWKYWNILQHSKKKRVWEVGYRLFFIIKNVILNWPKKKKPKTHLNLLIRNNCNNITKHMKGLLYVPHCNISKGLRYLVTDKKKNPEFTYQNEKWCHLLFQSTIFCFYFLIIISDDFSILGPSRESFFSTRLRPNTLLPVRIWCSGLSCSSRFLSLL